MGKKIVNKQLVDIREQVKQVIAMFFIRGIKFLFGVLIVSIAVASIDCIFKIVFDLATQIVMLISSLVAGITGLLIAFESIAVGDDDE